MTDSSRPPESSRYPDLYAPFIWASFGFAILGGFGLAGYLSVAFTYGPSVGVTTATLIQSHGHIQLLGWMGMLLLGVSMYVIPRITSNSSGSRESIVWIFRFAITGILLRVITPIVAEVVPVEQRILVHCIMVLGSGLQALAVASYLHFLVSGLRFEALDRNEIARLFPYFCSMAVGWGVFVLSDLWLNITALNSGSSALSPVWFAWQTELFLRLVLVPGILGFGVKMLPVFLGLRPPLWPVRRIGQFLLSSTLGLVGCRMLYALGYHLPQIGLLEAFASFCLSATILWYVWELDALLFRIRPERVSLKMFRTDSSKQRGRFGDRGEYGRFELFIVVGSAWLSFVAIVEAANAIAFILNKEDVISRVTLRHMLLLGFAAHMVFGVGHRLLPNLLHRSLRSPLLTAVAFGFLLMSSVSRTVPLVLSEYGVVLPRPIFSLSGSLGFLAIVTFAINVFGRRPASP